MAHNIIMRAFECSSPHNVPLCSHRDYVEQFSIQEAFQRLEKSFTKVKECRKEIGDLNEDSNKANIDQEDYNVENPNEVDLDVDENDDSDAALAIKKNLLLEGPIGPNGQHYCLVFEYLANNLLSLIKYYDYKGIPLKMVKNICYYTLIVLDYLHRGISIIHTDLNP